MNSARSIVHQFILLVCLLAGCADSQPDTSRVAASTGNPDTSRVAASTGNLIPEVKQPVEQELGPYRKDAAGGFSFRWLAYLVEPAEGGKGPWFVELNKRRFGPFDQVSPLVPISPDGQHLAFVAQEHGKWSFFLDGERRWTHSDVAWSDFTWTPDLEGNSVRVQTRAVDLGFSQDGNHLVYGVQIADDQWAVAVDGNLGPVFKSTSSRNRSFLRGQVLYSASTENSQVIVHGSKTFGPFEKVWLIERSPDGNHFAVVVVKNEEHYFLIDGKEVKIQGKPSDYAIGSGGQAACSYETDADTRVWFGGRELPGRYEDIALLTVSPDGKHVAFWAKQAGKWSPVIDGREYPGFDGYYLYRLGSNTYAFHWDAGSNLAYYARKGEEPVLALNGREVSFSSGVSGGFPVQAIVDDLGNIAGVSLVGGSMADSEAFVQCLLTREQTHCDPSQVSLVGGEVAFVESPDKQAFVVIGQNRSGPYPSVKGGGLLVSPEGKHYAIIVTDETKMQKIVLNGRAMPFLYDAIYRPVYLGERQLAHIGVRNGKVFGVQYPISP